ncbi:hypothetical protein NQ315_016515 [Exocentrus adspersus]|uniref:THAP-type domain-containing protein n=1 Tax=Exocentrus adspersus TaxID=1586481 RepID=A0AAV8VYV3_9CUCU|nr:hypothetical protein NQ315_016515 [Exocentrus adspersus]
MPGCAAVGCTNSSEKGYLMKTFPRDPIRKHEWAIRTQRNNWYPTRWSSLCEIHFEPQMWEKTRVDGSRKLKYDAVPTIFSDSKKPKRCRKKKDVKFDTSSIFIKEEPPEEMLDVPDYVIVKRIPTNSLTVIEEKLGLHLVTDNFTEAPGLWIGDISIEDIKKEHSYAITYD